MRFVLSTNPAYWVVTILGSGILAHIAWTNVTFQLEHSGLLVACIVAGIEALKFISVSCMLKLAEARAWGMALFFLCTSAMGYGGSWFFLSAQADWHAQQSLAIGTVEQKKAVARSARMKEVEAAIFDMRASRPVPDIQADIDSIAADSRANNCDSLDGEWSRKNCPKVFAWRKDLAAAKARDELRIELDDLKQAAAQYDAPVSTDATVAFLHKVSGISVATLSLYRPVLVALLLEIISVVCGIASGILASYEQRSIGVPNHLGRDPNHRGSCPKHLGRDPNNRGTPWDTVGHRLGQSLADTTMQVQHETGPVFIERMQKSYPMEACQLLLVIHSRGGRWVGTTRELDELLGVPRSSVSRLLSRMENEGFLTRHSDYTGTTLVLLREVVPQGGNVVSLQRSK